MFRKKLPNYKTHSYINPRFPISDSQALVALYVAADNRLVIFDYLENGERHFKYYSFSSAQGIPQARLKRWKNYEYQSDSRILKTMEAVKSNYRVSQEVQLKNENIIRMLTFMDELASDVYAVGEQDSMLEDMFGLVNVHLDFSVKSRCAIL